MPKKKPTKSKTPARVKKENKPVKNKKTFIEDEDIPFEDEDAEVRGGEDDELPDEITVIDQDGYATGLKKSKVVDMFEDDYEEEDDF